MLMFEATSRFFADRAKFGKKAKTLDSALAPTLEAMFPTNKYQAAFNETFSEYAKHADKVMTTVAGQKLRLYCREAPSKTALPQVLQALTNTTGLHLHYLPLPGSTGGNLVKECKRQVIVSLEGIECKNPQEKDGDEIYYITSGVLFGENKKLDYSSQVSPVTDHVGTGPGLVNQVKIPSGGYLKYPVFCNLNEKYLKPRPLPFYSVHYSFTLWEHDYSLEERINALADAMDHLTDAVNALGDSNYGGFAFYMAKFLIDLAISLDGDDLLGSCEFQFDNICQMPLPTTKDTNVVFHGTDFEYALNSQFKLEDLK